MATANELLRADIQAHARSLTEITTILMGLKKSVEELVLEKAVEDATSVKDEEALERRLKQIEKRLEEQTKEFEEKFNKIYKLGWWLLATFGASIILAFANFLLKGGLIITAVSSATQ